jgi:outer membrane protein
MRSRHSGLFIVEALLALGALPWLGFAQPAPHLTLAEAQQLAVRNNPQLTGARFTAAAAHQVAPQYQAAFQPSVSGSLTGVGADNGSRLAAGGLNNPIVYNRIGSGLSISQMLTDFGRTSNLAGMAKLQAEARDQAAETSRAQVLLDASRAYFALLRSQALLKVATQTVAARQTVVDQVTALAESKLKSNLDVSFANVNLSDAKLLLVQAQSTLKAAEADLATAMGLPNESGFTLEEAPLPAPMPDRIDELVRTATANRPELKSLRLDQSAAERFTRAEHALYYPSVAVAGTAGFVPTGYQTIPGRYGAIGLNVSIPVLNGGAFKARQTEAGLKAKAAAESVNDLENRVIRDVRVAWLNATTAYDRMGLTRQMLEQAKISLDLAQARYDLGLGNIVELSTAQLNVTSAAIADAGALYDYQTQRILFDYEIGDLH